MTSDSQYLADSLKRFVDRLEVSVKLDKKHIVDVQLKDKATIVVVVKKPIAAMELGLEHFLKHRKDPKSRKKEIIERIKDKGFKIKVKYGVFEMEL